MIRLETFGNAINSLAIPKKRIVPNMNFAFLILIALVCACYCHVRVSPIKLWGERVGEEIPRLIIGHAQPNVSLNRTFTFPRVSHLLCFMFTRNS